MSYEYRREQYAEQPEKGLAIAVTYLASGPLAWCAPLIALLDFLLHLVAKLGICVLLLGRHDGKTLDKGFVKQQKAATVCNRKEQGIVAKKDVRLLREKQWASRGGKTG